MDENLQKPQDRFAELRQRAEIMLSNIEKQFDAEDVDDIHKLLSELHIHQIELEMQNEELRQIQAQLASERQKYADLYNFAPAAYITVDENDIILELNLAAGELFGREPKYLTGRPITPYLTPESLEVFIQQRHEALRLGIPQSCILTIRSQKQKPAVMQTRLVALRSDGQGPQLWRAVMADITLVQETQQALHIKDRAIETSINAIAISDLQKRLTYVNPAFLLMWGYASQKEVLGKLVTRFWKIEDDAGQVVEALQSKGGWIGELTGLRKDGSLFDAQVSASMVLDESGRPAMMLASFIDITERKKAEKSLHERMKELTCLYAVARDMQEDISLGELCERILKHIIPAMQFPADTVAVIELDGTSFYSTKFNPADLSNQFTVELKGHDETTFGKLQVGYTWAGLSMLLEEKNLINGVGEMLSTWIERSNINEAHQASEERFRSLVNSLSDVIFTLDADQRHTGVYGDWVERSGLTPDFFIGRTAREIFGPENADAHEAANARALAGEPVSYEWSAATTSGIIHYHSAISPIRDASGKIIGVVGVGRDITPLKQVEEALRQSLKEKDMLMRELQHRTKNSLGVVASLLSLEKESLTDEHSRAIFASAEDRIHSIAAVYEQLYKGKSFENIDLHTYIQSLTDKLYNSYFPQETLVKIETRLEEIRIDLKRALPLGIILNELITNALKYAFPGSLAGKIQVVLRLEAPNITMEIIDNGVGIKPMDNPTTGLGLQLVQMLTDQIDGQFSLESGELTVARVSFPINPPGETA
jgi:PAS domain S-box-containing protein